MQYYSTNHHSPSVSFKEAMLRSEAPDGGLYMPERIPVLPKALINNLADMSIRDISYIVSNSFLSDDVPANLIKQISDTAVTFPTPLYEIEPGIYVLELFHGPTRTVKDISAQYVARLLPFLRQDSVSTINALIATNGNSGNALANAMHGMDDINLFVLYSKDVHRSQIDQINSYGDNIHAIEVNGHIDECLRIMSKAFDDKELNTDMRLTALNSFNVACLIGNIVTYFHAIASLKKKNWKNCDIHLSIPTGSAGNLLAALISKRMGNPVDHLVAACTGQAFFANFLEKGFECVHYDYRQKPLAYAMDLPRSANIPRFLELADGDYKKLQNEITTHVSTDAKITETINDVYQRTGYLLDPHSATSYRALKDTLPKGAIGIFMATSHPAKSIDVLQGINAGKLKLPPQLPVHNVCHRAEAKIPPTYGALKKVLRYASISQLAQNRV